MLWSDRLAQKYCQKIANKLSKEEKICAINVYIFDISRGYGKGRRVNPFTLERKKKGTVVIPSWARKKGKYYLIYYTIHEIAHVILDEGKKNIKHNIEFKQLEDRLLKRYNLSIKRKKIYPYAIYYKKALVYNERVS